MGTTTILKGNLILTWWYIRKYICTCAIAKLSGIRELHLVLLRSSKVPRLAIGNHRNFCLPIHSFESYLQWIIRINKVHTRKSAIISTYGNGSPFIGYIEYHTSISIPYSYRRKSICFSNICLGEVSRPISCTGMWKTCQIRVVTTRTIHYIIAT